MMMTRTLGVWLCCGLLLSGAGRAHADVAHDAPLLVTDPAVLEQLEAQGLALHRVLNASAPDTTALHASPLYHAFAELVALDDSVVKWRDPKAGTGFAPGHRLFDITWLSSPRTHFELIGVVNRTGRRFATPAHCGELRLIYRLAYVTSHVRSRLPLTLSLVFLQGSDCVQVATRWLALERTPRSQLAAALLHGPLATLGEPVRIETNFQSGRWPSALRPSLGGHAEYVLRAFRVEHGRAILSNLENTPTQKLSAAGRAELRRFLRAQLPAIDRGEIVLPARFWPSAPWPCDRAVWRASPTDHSRRSQTT